VVSDFDCIVIGAGVVGLACARSLSKAGYSVVILEANYAIGMETSSRNSEVIHSGIYYKHNSLKATACVEGRKKLYDYCKKRNIPHKKIGKLIVATNDKEIIELHKIFKKGLNNGVCDLKFLTQTEVQKIEPEVVCSAAIWCPSTGIIDSHSYMLALQGEIEDNGASIAFNTPLKSGKVNGDIITVEAGGHEPINVSTKLLINCTGLNAQSVANSISGNNEPYIPKGYFAKGVYFSLTCSSPFSHLIYPAPEQGGLGIHATLDMGGRCRFGPDVEWINNIDYTIDPRRGDLFYERVRRYWPGLKEGQLVPSYAGIRPKIVGPGDPNGDFIIQGPNDHKSGPFINLFGIESPGLTSALAISDIVLSIAKNVLD